MCEYICIYLYIYIHSHTSTQMCTAPIMIYCAHKIQQQKKVKMCRYMCVYTYSSENDEPQNQCAHKLKQEDLSPMFVLRTHARV